jgi:hypothetical protein
MKVSAVPRPASSRVANRAAAMSWSSNLFDDQAIVKLV